MRDPSASDAAGGRSRHSVTPTSDSTLSAEFAVGFGLGGCLPTVAIGAFLYRRGFAFGAGFDGFGRLSTNSVSQSWRVVSPGVWAETGSATVAAKAR
jgi:hypothetical protein